MAAVLRIPEKSGSEILLTYKLTKSNAKLETGAELVLEVNGDMSFPQVLVDRSFFLTNL